GDYDLVGTKSFGKGTVQQEFKIGEGELKLTIRKWLTPDGNWIHEKGIKPTVKVKQPDYYYASQIQVDEDESYAYDDNDDQIKNAQLMLDGLGYDVDRKDGYFSKQTEKAVKSFQNDHDLKETGKIDAKTASKIDQEIMDCVDQPENDRQLKKAEKTLTDHLKDQDEDHEEE